MIFYSIYNSNNINKQFYLYEIVNFCKISAIYFMWITVINNLIILNNISLEEIKERKPQLLLI